MPDNGSVRTTIPEETMRKDRGGIFGVNAVEGIFQFGIIKKRMVVGVVVKGNTEPLTGLLNLIFGRRRHQYRIRFRSSGSDIAVNVKTVITEKPDLCSGFDNQRVAGLYRDVAGDGDIVAPGTRNISRNDRPHPVDRRFPQVKIVNHRCSLKNDGGLISGLTQPNRINTCNQIVGFEISQSIGVNAVGNRRRGFRDKTHFDAGMVVLAFKIGISQYRGLTCVVDKYSRRTFREIFFPSAVVGRNNVVVGVKILHRFVKP